MGKSETGIEKAIRMAGSQRILAERMGVTQQAVSEWQRKGYPPVERIDHIIEAAKTEGEQLRPRDLLDPEILGIVDSTF